MRRASPSPRQPQNVSPAPTVSTGVMSSAGDTFCGYLGDGLARRMPFDAALRRAAAAGSLACLKRGAQPSIPTDEEVAAWL